jgi:hypothetical protein
MRGDHFRVVLVTILALLFGIKAVQAQNTPVPVECGNILEAEVPTDYVLSNTAPNAHYYTLRLTPGDKLTVEVKPIGSAPNFFFRLHDPANTLIFDTGWGNVPGGAERLENYEVGATGIYTIGIGSQPPGAYTLSIGCIFRNGTVINPGDIISTSPGADNGPIVEVTRAFSGVGFPGLAPIDMASVARIPMIPATPITGAVSATGGEILAYTFDADAGSKYTFEFSRLSGNLNLGLVVLSPDNTVAFQASLVVSETVATRLMLPSDGQYLIGVFRIDVNPPATAEPTAFQLQVTASS